jgi:hypothetical protein
MGDFELVGEAQFNTFTDALLRTEWDCLQYCLVKTDLPLK